MLANQNTYSCLSANESGAGVVVWLTIGRQERLFGNIIAIPFEAVRGTEIAQSCFEDAIFENNKLY